MNPIRIALDKATGSAMLLRRATLCAVIAALAGIALLALAGWFLTAAAMAGASSARIFRVNASDRSSSSPRRGTIFAAASHASA